MMDAVYSGVKKIQEARYSGVNCPPGKLLQSKLSPPVGGQFTSRGDRLLRSRMPEGDKLLQSKIPGRGGGQLLWDSFPQ